MKLQISLLQVSYISSEINTPRYRVQLLLIQPTGTQIVVHQVVSRNKYKLAYQNKEEFQ